MKKLLTLCMALLCSSCFAILPNPHIYERGTLVVPENYSFSASQKLGIYWEKLKSTSASPQAIILINGGPGMSHDGFHRGDGNGGYLKDWLYALRTDFDIYYFDQRGTGESSKLSYDILSRRNIRLYGVENICRDIEELRKNVIKKDKIVVFGESYGGMVALKYAIMYPDRVAKLVIHDSSPSNEYFTHMHKNFSEMLAVLDLKLPGVKENMVTSIQKFDKNEVSNAYNIEITGRDFLSIILNYTYSMRGQVIIAYMVQDIALNGRSDILDALLGSMIGREDEPSFFSLPPTIVLVQTYEMLDEKVVAAVQAGPDYQPWNYDWLHNNVLQSRRDFREYVRLNEFKGYNVISQLSKITAPTLVMVGETDFICPPAYAQIIKDNIGSHCRLITIQNSSHSGFVEQNEYVVGKIRNFLSGYWPGYDYREKSLAEFSSRNVSREEAIQVWLEGAKRLAIGGFADF
ncbi:MAG: alpha/beta hydrolase [Candidatus Riflebacteria bacterium]|nr:alpha/beta hydrolase [Candidatus Riflebacteria bacterium]